jgi:23S rRNA pseudouridine1911/1915/1917 synthase
MSKFKYIVTTEDEGQPVKWIIRNRFSFSARMRTKIKHGELAYLNGEKTLGWIPVKAGDVMEINLPDERSDFEAEDIPISVVYEDDDLLVINKQAGIVVHPTMGQPRHTLANAVQHYMSESGQAFKIRFVNRLDRDTSGLIIVAKNAFAQEELTKQMKEGKVSKRYNALLCGIIENDGTIDKPIGRPDPVRVERGVMPVEAGGFPSVTHYKVIKSFAYPSIKLGNVVTSGLGENGENLGIDREDLRLVYSKIDRERMEELIAAGNAAPCEGITLAEIRLATGRTHQIRVHMGSIGHHVVGDTLYGGVLGNVGGISSDGCRAADDNCTCSTGLCAGRSDTFSPIIERQALHARYLSFYHPISGEHMELEAPLPQDIMEVYERIRPMTGKV